VPPPKGVGRKFSRGPTKKKDQKLAKIPKNSTICVFQGEDKGKKPKIAK